MNLRQKLIRAARACEGAACALAYALCPDHQTAQLPPLHLDMYHQAEAFAITCRAVMDEMTIILPLLDEGAPCVGKAQLTPGQTRISNGFDTISLILLSLLTASNNAILDAAAVRSRSLLAPLNVASCCEKMITHHGQLRAMYGIIHLATKIIHHVDVSKTLFTIPTHGDDSENDLHPAKLRAAIKLDDFYGRGFGFHYAPEMRNVLRVVNIARGSVHKSHAEDDASPQFVKNVFMLGWGWVYSNMVLMNNLGFSIEGASRIGADENGMTIGALRKFMNLVEEPIVAGVSSFVSADVAIDNTFDIPPPGASGGMEAISSPSHNEHLRNVLSAIQTPVRARLMSHKNRPIELPNMTVKEKLQRRHKPSTIKISQSSHSVHKSKLIHEEKQRNEQLDDQEQVMMPNATEDKGVNVENSGNGETGEGHSNAKLPFGWSGVVDQSYLATAFKSSVTTIQTNVTSFLGLEEAKPASALIIHFHGGGFVSQSSVGHQVYMKEICAEIPDAVMLSIDYKLAPEFKFPVALYECTYAYMWALQNAALVGTLAEKIVLTGDSAGGNLAVATSLLLSKLGVRAPDSICIAYPALYIKQAWSPSRLLSFFDPMLPLSVLELCVKSYAGDEEGLGDKNELLSPVVASDEQLKQLPIVNIMCGSLDPLLDDSALFAKRLLDVGREEDTLRVIESMPHGFMNLIQVNPTAHRALNSFTTTIAEGLGVPLKKRGFEKLTPTKQVPPVEQKRPSM